MEELIFTQVPTCASSSLKLLATASSFQLVDCHGCKKFQNCRWNVVREAVDNTKVAVDDSSRHKINWRWEVRGGQWDVTYTYKYPEEWYSGRAVFVKNFGGENAYVSWGSSDPWSSNAVPVSATPWKITYNGDTFGFIPTYGGRYIFKVFTKNKRHDPFAGSEPHVLHPAPCSLSASDSDLLNAGFRQGLRRLRGDAGAYRISTEKLTRWWQTHKRTKQCPAQSLAWAWAGKKGKWTVFYNYEHAKRLTNCDVYYESPGVSQIKVINWKLDEVQQTASYVSFPVGMHENGWRISLTPAETWGFTPSENGRWVFQHFSRNLEFQPFNGQGNVVYDLRAAVPAKSSQHTVKLLPVKGG